jgi:hypothetical protein
LSRLVGASGGAITSERLEVAFVTLSDQEERKISAQGCWSEVLRRYAPQNDRFTEAGIQMRLPSCKLQGLIILVAKVTGAYEKGLRLQELVQSGECPYNGIG